jgi:hypothetical protein
MRSPISDFKSRSRFPLPRFAVRLRLLQARQRWGILAVLAEIQFARGFFDILHNYWGTMLFQRMGITLGKQWKTQGKQVVTLI